MASRRRSAELTARPVAVDLFCGAGGLSNGLEDAGFHVALGLDNDPHVAGTYQLNHPNARFVQSDIRKVNGSDILRWAGRSEIDLLAGGPSCQGFSTHGKRLADDPRNFLYQEFMRLVAEVRPATVLMENVKGLLIARKGAYRDEVIESFEKLGYAVTGNVLLAADFGVPQLRQRVFFIATRLGSEVELPRPTYRSPDLLESASGVQQTHLTVSEAISDLPLIGDNSRIPFMKYSKAAETRYQSLLRAGSDGIVNHMSRPLSDHARTIMEQVAPGQGLRSLPVHQLPERFLKMRTISNGQLRRDCTTLYHRLSPNRPSYTITCYFTNVSAGAFTHPIELRSITAREAARLQSFPDSFHFIGPGIPKQIGNAVPPMLAKAVGTVLHGHLQMNGIVAA